MAFKTILNVTGVSEIDQDLQVAMDLCSQVGAHLSVFLAVMAPQPTGRYTTLAPRWLEQRERNLQELAERVGNVRDRIAKTELSFDVDSVYAEVAGASYAIGQRALYADLLLVGPAVFGNEDLKSQIVNGSLFQAQRPVLFVPPGSKATLQPRTVLLAWDSRPSSTHAARDALEMMKAAESVHVTMVDPVLAQTASGEEPGADVAAYLARHGINVSVENLPSSGRAVPDVLQQHAVDIDADMIVMGAYGHSRLLELLLGGVMKSTLKHAKSPIFMAH
ncbi:universal stress protein [Ensifer sp. ENS11]|uniref:universal stress protein n=1 Tax=Ensifer sp. ENS11 TaxID=2769291 RepID=UPI00177D0F0D|nr:universal stress protein [Ensifer sp. ENS11]MBD9491525.1 universal stress protein [Ensifer sp. ENS11]MDP9634611.1 nucleotide-binding universal stress UspA family protein [Ensifer adhaerens]